MCIAGGGDWRDLLITKCEEEYCPNIPPTAPAHNEQFSESWQDLPQDCTLHQSSELKFFGTSQRGAPTVENQFKFIVKIATTREHLEQGGGFFPQV